MLRKYLMVLTMVSLFIQVQAQKEIPVLSGNWWQIGENEPDVSPYNNPGVHNSCDFTIYEDAYGKWHCISCIRLTTYPGMTRLFYEWVGDSLTQTNWTPNGIFWTSGTVGAPDAIGNELGVNTPYTQEGRMQAPHCFKHNGKYYMIHNNFGAFFFISDDGVNWDYHKNTEGDYKFFDMSRDVMVFNDLDKTDKFYAYFAEGWDMAFRTTSVLEDSWSDLELIGTSGNPESPFSVRKGENDYYLWQAMSVYYSNDPTKFRNAPITKMTPDFFNHKAAPEIIQYNGEWYIAGYDDGIWLSKFTWESPDDPAMNSFLKSMTIAEGSTNEPFDSARVRYTMVVPNAVTSLSITATPSNPLSTVDITHETGFIEGENIVEVAVSTPSDASTHVYEIYVTRLAVGQPTYTLTVNGGEGSGEFVEGAEVEILADIPTYGKDFDYWSGADSVLWYPNSFYTKLDMPASSISVTANYYDLPIHTLTVNRGTPNGDYNAGEIIEITADAAHVDSVFYKWEGDISNLNDIYSSPTNLTLPDADVNLTAIYRASTSTLYTLTVNNGSGSGIYLPGELITVIADPAPLLQDFEKWIGDVSYLADEFAESTVVTIPASDITIDVLYSDGPPASPQNISAITGENLVDLDWDNNSELDFDYYTVYRSSTSGSGYAILADNLTSSDYSDNSVVSGNTYYYVITAVDTGSNESPYSLEYAATPMVGSAVYVASDSSMNDAWRSTNFAKPNDIDGDNVYGTDGYYIFAIEGGGEMVDLPTYIESVTFGTNSSPGFFGPVNPIDDPSLIPGSDLANINSEKLDLDIADNTEGEFLTIKMAQTISFRLGVYSGHKDNEVAQSIRVQNGSSTTSQIHLSTKQQYTLIDVTANAGEEIMLYGTTRAITQTRNAISAIFFDCNYDFPPSTPQNIGATPGNSVVDIDWDDNIESDFNHYKIYRSTTSGGGFILIADNLLTSNYSDNTVTNGITYYYVLKAVDDADGESSYSSEVSAKPFIPTYLLTVNDGIGTGNYEEGEVVTIIANTPATCEEFSAWTGDIGLLDDSGNDTTFFTMPSSAIIINATYSSMPLYTVNVDRGNGDGDYCEGTVISVQADVAHTDSVFYKWLGDVQYLDDENAITTDLTMPANAVNITANYVEVPDYSLSVLNGSGSGNYKENESVIIIANDSSGYVFDNWSGDVIYLDATDNDTATVTMPAQNIEVYAQFSQIAPPTYDITFSVSDGSQQLEEANVNFNSENTLTNIDGIALFANIDTGSQIAYSVTLAGYDTINGVLDLFNNDTVYITLTELIPDLIKDKEHNVLIYPNPASNKIFIQVQNKFRSINISDLSGKILIKKEKDLDKLIELDISHLQSGVYIIILEFENNLKLNKRIIVK